MELSTTLFLSLLSLNRQFISQMSVSSNFPSPHLKSPSAPRQNLAILHQRALHVREYRLWRRGRLKTTPTTVRARSQLGPLPSFENLFQTLLSQFPSVNSLDLIAPCLGFASGVAIYLSRLNSSSSNSPILETGEWILFASPTPFNRFVMLRCPSISFEGSESLADVNDKLVEEDRHFVKLNSGKIQIRGSDEEVWKENLVYQRECVSTDDGGVVSLDWSANLHLTEERGLDTTLLLIPGTAEGSMDDNIRSFVCESLKRGCFSVVMNPRGCAGSPLITPRLFTAADSDDIGTAVQFVNKARPWTTLMGVGWGYGANMLTKYLAEVGEKTPLTAAACIDNPFDLEEATRSSPYHVALDQKLTGGLVEILRSNKELFRGKAKGFDVENALLANSVRDFEKSISMISYGFEAIEDFYASSSTGNLVGNVKIPVLFIQNDDAIVPLFSIPRSLIAENPFTSLLLCSCLPSNVIASGRWAISWCQHLTIQWLAAVELGLLKGRHPLLKNVDVTINPLKGFALLDSRVSDTSGRVNKLNLSQSKVVNGYAGYPFEEKLEESDTTASIGAKFRQDPPRIPEIEDNELQQENNGTLKQTSSVNAELANEEVSPVDVEKGQVIQTAEVVMNMLDATMPGTLTEEQKKKVLTSLGQGKTFMNTFQDAVPQDVRAKLTTAVSEILHTRGTNVKFEGVTNIGPIVALGLDSKIQENVGGLSRGGSEDPHSLGVDDLSDSCNDNQVTLDKTAVGLESEFQASDTLQNPIDTGQVQPNNNQPTQNMDISREGTAKDFDNSENRPDIRVQPDFSSQPEMVSGTEDSASNHSKTDQSYPASSAEAQPTERVNDLLKSEENNMNSVLNPCSSNSQTFSVSQALDALTKMDDSTQVAVNSVFGVIEDMITQLNNKTDVEDKVGDRGTGSTTENLQFTKDMTENRGNDLSSQSDMLDNRSLNEGRDSMIDSNTRTAEKEKHIESSDSLKGNNMDNCGENDTDIHVNKAGSGTSEYFASRFFFSEHSNEVRHIRTLPLLINANTHSAPLYKEYLRKYLLSKIQNTESLDLDRNNALFLEYIPEGGQWKLFELPGNIEYSGADIATEEGVKEVNQVHSPSKEGRDEVIEPSHVIMDTEKQQEPVREYDTVDRTNEKVVIGNGTAESFVKGVILDSLKVEVERRLSAESTKEMEPNLSQDAEHFANAVSLAAGCRKTQIWFLGAEDCNLEKLGTLNGEHLVRAMSIAIQETNYLRSVLPYAVVVGSCLATLRKFFDIVVVNCIDQTEAMALHQINNSLERNHVQLVETETDQVFNKVDHKYNVFKSADGEKTDLKKLSKGSAVVGVVTAALGASAVLVHQRASDKGNSTSTNLANSSEEKGNHHEEPDKLEEEKSENGQNNIVTSLAEKAMSVAGPVVPMKEDGEVDQDRLVALLAELGQKGGMLRLFGKVALLWGGLRGAMSLTDRLILFLHIAERPLFQRLLGFVCMVLVLWSPVLVPLLPTLVQSWATHNSSKYTELICIIGLYSSITILVMLWGKRIRGYENPFEQYGLDFTSPSKIQNFLKGLVGGVVVVLSVHSLNALLGCVCLSWPSASISNSSDVVTWIKVYGKMLLLVVQGLVTGTGVALVEELIFRSWLPDEIATDFGYYHGIIISGLTFSLAQRSPWAVPGLCLLSLGLAGARQRSGGSLSIPIGLRAGIMSSNFILQTGGFLTYQTKFPKWVVGAQPFQPFTGIFGLAFSLLLAVVLHPREPLHQQKITKTICE